MEQAITDYASFLKEAKQAVIDVAQMRDQENILVQKAEESQKTYEAEERAVAENISQTIKKRTEEINLSYDKELNKGQERLKKARSKREKAKSQGVKERIVEETSELREQNRQLSLQIKTVFQQNHVPQYCNSKLYYSLYSPRWISEYALFLGAVLLCFLVIPYGLYLLIPGRNPIYLVGIYMAAIILFGGCYIMIGNKTKVRYAQTLKAGRILRDQIHSNQKKTKVITRSIKKDRNEAVYNLQKHDDEIAQSEQELADIAAKKKDALNTFENVTKNIISDEIANNSKGRIAQLKTQYEAQEQELKELTEAAKTRNLYITDHYETYLGKDFLQPQKLDALADIIRNGTATNLSEAIAEYKKKDA
ncbi:MAG: hypothetical protein RR593_01600 [Hungatella sp.]